MQSLDAPALVPLSPRVRVDLAHQRVWRDGLPISLRPKAWQALVYLLRRPGELVSSDELLDALWPRQEISAKTMANLVSELRAALADDQAAAALLQTVHRRGYPLQLHGAAGPTLLQVLPEGRGDLSVEWERWLQAQGQGRVRPRATLTFNKHHEAVAGRPRLPTDRLRPHRHRRGAEGADAGVACPRSGAWVVGSPGRLR